jgi:hypothetical protein
MSVVGVLSTSLVQTTTQPPVSGRQQKDDTWRQLEQALQSGDQAAAQQAYDTLAASGPNNSGPFSSPKRTAEFESLGQSIQSGDLGGALQQANTIGGQQLNTDFKIYERDAQSGNPAGGQALSNLEGDFWAVTGQQLTPPPPPPNADASSPSSPATAAINLQA